jgi:hypothetical protein
MKATELRKAIDRALIFTNLTNTYGYKFVTDHKAALDETLELCCRVFDHHPGTVGMANWEEEFNLHIYYVGKEGAKFFKEVDGKDVADPTFHEAICMAAYAANYMFRGQVATLLQDEIAERIWKEVLKVNKGEPVDAKTMNLKIAFDHTKDGKLAICDARGVFALKLGKHKDSVVTLEKFDPDGRFKIKYVEADFEISDLAEELVDQGFLVADEEFWDDYYKEEIAADLLSPTSLLVDGISVRVNPNAKEPDFLGLFQYVLNWIEFSSEFYDELENFLDGEKLKGVSDYQDEYYQYLVEVGNPINPEDDFDIREFLSRWTKTCPSDIVENIELDQERFVSFLQKQGTLVYVF